MALAIQREQRLREDIATLASQIGERNLYHYDRLLETADFIQDSGAGWVLCFPANL
jgi:hypothetical protein